MNKKLWEASTSQKKKSLLSNYEQFISKKFNKKFNQKYENILKWSIETQVIFGVLFGIFLKLKDLRVKLR